MNPVEYSSRSIVLDQRQSAEKTLAYALLKVCSLLNKIS